jgi:phenylalanyl-tRNA synthetase beta subunit
MECGQPLHTFDYARLQGAQIIVRRPKPGETIEAIDHTLKELGYRTERIGHIRRLTARIKDI